jgi:hypothetical protein
MQKNKQENCMDELEWVPESDDTGNIYANLPRPQDMLSSARERGKKAAKQQNAQNYQRHGFPASTAVKQFQPWP